MASPKLRTVSPEPSEEDAAWRETLEGNIKNWRASIRGLEFERRSKDRMLSVASAGQLRMARYKSRKIPDPSEAGKQAILERLAQLDYEIEMAEAMVEDAEAELAQLPESAPAE